MEELKRLRNELGWSQQRLADESGVNKATINQVEQGKRSPSITTLESLADAMGREIGDFFPKAQSPLPLEITQRASVPDALSSYMRRRAESLEAELKDGNSPHFKDATAATVWVAGVQREARDWADWAAEEVAVLMPQRDGLLDTFRDALKVSGHLMTFHAIARKAERRIAAMADNPDELARKRLEKARREARESEQRLNDVKKVADG